MKLPQQRLEELEISLKQAKHVITDKDTWERWLHLPITQLMLMEMEHAYLEACVGEPVVMACPIATGEQPVYRSNPVEETAINAAIRAGQLQALETVLMYEPINLERGESDES